MFKQEPIHIDCLRLACELIYIYGICNSAFAACVLTHVSYLGMLVKPDNLCVLLILYPLRFSSFRLLQMFRLNPRFYYGSRFSCWAKFTFLM